MPTFVNISGNSLEMPGDGTTPTRVVEPDGTVEAETNPAPGSFDEARGSNPNGNPQPTAATTEE